MKTYDQREEQHELKKDCEHGPVELEAKEKNYVQKTLCYHANRCESKCSCPCNTFLKEFVEHSDGKGEYLCVPSGVYRQWVRLHADTCHNDEPMLQPKYMLYSTNKNGDGCEQKIGEFDDPEEIEIHVGHFAEDVVISIETK